MNFFKKQNDVHNNAAAMERNLRIQTVAKMEDAHSNQVTELLRQVTDKDRRLAELLHESSLKDTKHKNELAVLKSQHETDTKLKVNAATAEADREGELLREKLQQSQLKVRELEADLKAADKEREYAVETLKNFRSMPDLKDAVTSIQSVLAPSLGDLQKLAEVMSPKEGTVAKLDEVLRAVISLGKSIPSMSEIEKAVNHGIGRATYEMRHGMSRY